VPIRNTDRQWEKFGKDDPYFGVLSQSRFKTAALTEETRAEFFRSGEEHIAEVLRKVHEHIDRSFTPRKAMDFGCGVGRLVIPLSRVAKEVTGVDVSASMLTEARKNCDARSIQNVKLVSADDELTALETNYDFIHSFIVFQHIPVQRGELIFQRLIAQLADGGVCVVHFTYGDERPIKRLIWWIRRIPLAANFANLLRGRRFSYPSMEMNSYDLNRLLRFLNQCNARDVYAELTDHGGKLGVVLYFKKPAR